MPVMIEKGQVRARGTGGADPDAERGVSTERDVTRGERCACDECQARARDEMWTRWA